jgi:UDP-glucose 4-epimerase
VVSIFCQNLQDGIAPEIQWDGEQTRDFCYVGDCARANLAALAGGDNQAYNVGTGKGTSINALFAALTKISGQALEARQAPRRPGDVRHSYLDCAKIERDLGWQAKVGLDEGLEQTWHYMSVMSKKTETER